MATLIVWLLLVATLLAGTLHLRHQRATGRLPRFACATHTCTCPARPGPGGDSVDRAGRLHNTTGPARRRDGTTTWYHHGARHRTDGPATVNVDTGETTWLRHGRPIDPLPVIMLWLDTHEPPVPALTRTRIYFAYLQLTGAWPGEASLADIYPAIACTTPDCDCPTTTRPDGTPVDIAGRPHHPDQPQPDDHHVRHWRRHGSLHRDDGPAIEPAPDTTATSSAPVWFHDGARVLPQRVIDTWLARHHPQTPPPVRATLLTLAENWQPGETMTALHTAAVTAHT